MEQLRAVFRIRKGRQDAALTALTKGVKRTITIQPTITWNAS